MVEIVPKVKLKRYVTEIVGIESVCCSEWNWMKLNCFKIACDWNSWFWPVLTEIIGINTVYVVLDRIEWVCDWNTCSGWNWMVRDWIEWYVTEIIEIEWLCKQHNSEIIEIELFEPFEWVWTV